MRDEIYPIIRARGACTAARVRAERGASTAEGVSVEVAGTAEGLCRLFGVQTQLGC